METSPDALQSSNCKSKLKVVQAESTELSEHTKELNLVNKFKEDKKLNLVSGGKFILLIEFSISN